MTTQEGQVNGHMEEGTLIAYLDGELDAPERTRVARHLRSCEACIEALEGLRSAARRLTTALERLDVPPPAWLGPAVRDAAAGGGRTEGRAARAGAAPGPGSGGAGLGSAAPPGPGSGDGRAAPAVRRWLIAASLLFVAGTAAAAVPGSPVRAWVERQLDDVARVLGAGETGEGVVVATDSVATTGAGVAIRPTASLEVVIRDPAEGTWVTVRVVEDDRASVHASGARYRTSSDRIEVLGPAGGEVRVEIPARLERAGIQVDGRPLLRKEGSNLRVLAPADSADTEVVFELGRDEDG